MGHGGDGDFLCTRCGAVVPALSPSKDGTSSGSCPECGLGFSGALMQTRRRRRFGFGRRRDARRDAGAMQRFEDEFTTVFARPPFDVYGLDDRWQGRRWPGGIGRSGSTVEQVELGHGDPLDDSSTVIRVTTRRSADPAAVVFATAAQELVHGIWRPGMPRSAAMRAPFGTDDPTAGWDDVDLLLDGVETTFAVLRHGDEWAAIAALADGSTVTVEARHVDPTEVRLARLRDLSAYLDAGAFPWRRRPG